MADITIESAVRDGDKVTVTGTGFTKTTTTVEVDGTPTAFEIPVDVTDGTKLIVSDVPAEASEITVIKGEVEQSTAISGEAGGAGPTTGSSSGGYPAQGSSDVSSEELATAANAGAGAKTPQNPTPAEQGTYESQAHLPGANVNETVAQTKLDRIEEEWGIGPRDPYPVGSPPDPEDVHQRLHGYRRDDSAEKQAQLDADPAT